MGRYDKIKVYNNGSWHTPNRIRVYNNGWKDLGTADSYNTSSLNVRNGNSFARATLNRQDYTTVTDRYASGTFKLLPANGFCYCTKSSSAGNWDWYFRCTIKKTTNTEQNIFWAGSTNYNPSNPGSNYVQIKWLADGKIRVGVSDGYGGGSHSLTSSNSVLAGNEVYLNVYVNAGSRTMYIVFNGVTTSGSMGSAFSISNSWNQVGDANMIFKGTLSAAGVKYSKQPKSVSFDVSTASGTDNSQYENVTHQETTTTGTRWI